jgi:ComF family protein
MPKQQNLESSSISRHLSNIGNSILNICININQSVLSQNCLLCGTASGKELICHGCLTSLPFHMEHQCPVCALPSPDSHVCGKCLRQAPFFDSAFAALRYEFPVDAIIHGLKYGSKLAIAPLLGDLIADRVQALPKPDLLIPMPLHGDRLRERGFNQSIEMSRTIGHHLNIPISHACKRVRATTSQASLSLEARTANLKGAFQCDHSVEGLQIAVVDDVMTSGASMNELARTLKKQGAREVSAWVAARTL